MEVQIDETVCGPLCQHPSCWDSQRRQAKGITGTHKTSRHRPTSPEDEGLPTQNIVNLLDEYGDDPEDKYPSKHAGKARHDRAASMPNYKRPSTRESGRKFKTPMVTPISQLQSSSAQVSVAGTENEETEAPKGVNRVEVQEVFDLDDLRSQWQETFVARQYYVWVPNPKASEKRKNREELKKKLTVTPLVDSAGSIVPRNVTEIMLPKDVEYQRGDSKMNFLPDYGFFQPTIPKRRNIKSPKSPQHGHPYLRSPYSYNPRSPKDGYYGIYELLDLPKDVLLKVLDYVDRRDMMDRERLAEALTRAFPRLEQENSSLSMAYGDVLQQRQMMLRDMSNRSIKKAIPARQIFLMGSPQPPPPDTAKKPPPPVSHTPPPRQITPTPSLTGPELSRTPGQAIPPSSSHTGRHGSGKGSHPMSGHQGIPRKPPLPSIPVTPREDSVAERPKVVSVSLGLPELPSGVKITKPFMYKNKDLDLTLGPVATPSPLPSCPSHVSDPAEEKKPESAPSSDHAPSVVHVAMPSVPVMEKMEIHVPHDTTMSDIKPRNKTPSTAYMDVYMSEGSWSMPLHHVSPDLSTHVPKTPAATPATRGLNSVATHTQDGSPLPAKMSQEAHGSPMATRGSGLPGSAPGGTLLGQSTGLSLITPDPTGMLGTIHESIQDENQDLYKDLTKSDLPKSRRSVRFAPNIPPPQPPSSPNQSDRSVSPIRDRAPGAESLANNYSTSGNVDILTVHGTKDAPASRESTKYTSALSQDTGRTLNSPVSTDLWPQVDEDAFNKTPSPLPSTAKTLSSVNGGDKSVDPQYDNKSEPSGLTSMVPSRESTFNKITQREDVAESPGPPPPSPEPSRKQQRRKSSDVSKLNGVSENYEDIPDTDSEITITAKPPSNIDDLSRIQTPATPYHVEACPENTAHTRQVFEALLSEAASEETSSKIPADKVPDENVVDQDNPESADQQPDEAPIEIQTELLPESKSSDSDVHETCTTENNELSLVKPEVDIKITPETRPGSEDDAAAPPEADVSSEHSVDIATPVENSVLPQNPAYPQTIDEDQDILGTELDQKLSQLDHFDNTEDMLKDELREELSKLSNEENLDESPEEHLTEQIEERQGGLNTNDLESEILAKDLSELSTEQPLEQSIEPSADGTIPTEEEQLPEKEIETGNEVIHKKDEKSESDEDNK